MAAPTLTTSGIRTDLVERLKGKTGAGDNVLDSRQSDFQPKDVPAIVVHSVGHTDQNRSLGGLIYQREESVGILGIVTGSSDAALAAAVDAIELQILQALLQDMEWTVRARRAPSGPGGAYLRGSPRGSVG